MRYTKTKKGKAHIQTVKQAKNQTKVPKKKTKTKKKIKTKNEAKIKKQSEAKRNKIKIPKQSALSLVLNRKRPVRHKKNAKPKNNAKILKCQKKLHLDENGEAEPFNAVPTPACGVIGSVTTASGGSQWSLPSTPAPPSTTSASSSSPLLKPLGTTVVAVRSCATG